MQRHESNRAQACTEVDHALCIGTRLTGRPCRNGVVRRKTMALSDWKIHQSRVIWSSVSSGAGVGRFIIGQSVYHAMDAKTIGIQMQIRLCIHQ